MTDTGMNYVKIKGEYYNLNMYQHIWRRQSISTWPCGKSDHITEWRGFIYLDTEVFEYRKDKHDDFNQDYENILDLIDPGEN